MRIISIAILLLLMPLYSYSNENQIKVNQYIKEKGLESIVSFASMEKGRHAFVFKTGCKLTNLQKKSLIKLHNLGAFNASFIYMDYRPDMHGIYVSYDILRFLTQYAIKHKDVFLFESLLNGNIVSRGDGEYAESFDEVAIVPLILNFPDVDKYLSDSQVQALSAVIFFDWFEVNGNGNPNQYRKLNKVLSKQSKRLTRHLETYLKGMILVTHNKLEYDDFNKYISAKSNVPDINMFFSRLLEKYGLTKELEKYQKNRGRTKLSVVIQDGKEK